MRVKIFLLFSFLLLVVVFFWGPTYARYVRLRDKVSRTKKEIKMIENINKRLRRKIKELSEDSLALEEVARYRYKMGKPGEVVYVVDEKKTVKYKED